MRIALYYKRINSHFSFLHHMSGANASFLEWNGKCFIAEWNGLPRRNEMKTGAASSSGVFYEAFSGFMFFCLEIKAKKWRIRLRPSGLRRDKERGIWTLGIHKDTTIFETVAFDHSAISPLFVPKYTTLLAERQKFFAFFFTFFWKTSCGKLHYSCDI